MTSVTVVIPTIGRYTDLQRLLDSIGRQSARPDGVFIIDSGSGPCPVDFSRYAFPVTYTNCRIVSLTAKRNYAIRSLGKTTDFICFLDDDIVLTGQAFTTIKTFLATAPSDIGGVCFNTIHGGNPYRYALLKQFFFTGSATPGEVLKSGCHTLIADIPHNVFTKWLPGGVTAWRREIFDQILFDDAFTGLGYLEDVDFSYRAGKRYRLMCLANARVEHHTDITRCLSYFTYGAAEIINRFYFITKHREFSRILFIWSSIGRIFESLAIGVIRLKGRFLLRAAGHLYGLLRIAFSFGRLRPYPSR